jgi:hypothetical protein
VSNIISLIHGAVKKRAERERLRELNDGSLNDKRAVKSRGGVGATIAWVSRESEQ